MSGREHKTARGLWRLFFSSPVPSRLLLGWLHVPITLQALTIPTPAHGVRSTSLPCGPEESMPHSKLHQRTSPTFSSPIV
jgi:hypothetical protein